MKVLVTGGAGYVGGVSVDALLAAGHGVVVLDDLSTGHRAAVPPEARLVQGSYGDEAAVRALIEAEGIEAVLHCAARSLVGESVHDPAKYYRDNVAGGVALLEAARTAGVRRLVFSSTASVYGVPDSTPVAVSNVRPVGSVPVSDQVIVPMPPACVNACEYAEPAVPLGTLPGLTASVWQSTTRV